MKLVSMLTAGAVALAGLAPLAIAPAAAQHSQHTRTVVTQRTVVRHEGPQYRHHARKTCSWKYRNHHRVRVCRTVYR